MSIISIASIVVFISGLLNMLLGLGIYHKAVKNTANRLFVILTFVTSVWAFVNSYYLSHFYYPYTNLAYSVGAWVPFFILIWVTYFTGLKLKKSYIYICALLTSCISIIALVPNTFIKVGVEYYYKGYGVVPGALFSVFALYVSTLAIIAFVIFYSRWRETTGLQRIQYNYIFFGIVFPTSVILIFDFILPIFNINSFATFDSTLSLVFVSVIGYSITRYRFLDLKLVIRKGVVHFLSLLIALFTYIYLLIFFQRILTSQYHWSEQTSTIILVLAIVISLEPLRKGLIWLIDRTFFYKADDIHDDKNIQLILSTTQQFELLIRKLEKELEVIGSVNDVWFQWDNKQTGQLVDITNETKGKIVKSGDGLYTLINERMDVIITEELPYQLEAMDGAEAERVKKALRQLKEGHIGLVLPIGERGELIGAFFFGQRPNKSAFTSEIAERIHALQRPVTSAVANALFYKQAVERIASIGGK